MHPTFELDEIIKKEPKKFRPQLVSTVKDPSRQEGVDLNVKAQGLLLPSFIACIIGNPGAGKSTLVEQLLLSQQLYGQKFERVLFVGPTTYPDLIQDDFNTRKAIDVNWLYSHIQAANQWKCKNMLIVFDDVLSTLKASSTKSKFIDLFYNRRHLLDNGTISIVITCQKWNMVPTFARTAYNMVFAFPVARPQAEIMGKQLGTGLSPKALVQALTGLKKHSFIYFNLEDGTAFDDEWQQL